MTDARFIASESYYAQVEDSVLQTPRGRWFLREYARRNRIADTNSVLDAIDRLIDTNKSGAALSHVEILRRELQEMSHSIVQTRREIAAIKPSEDGNNRIMAATEELDAIVTATERATGDILTAAERLQELAGELQSSDANASLCDEITMIGTNILMACSFQDLTGQRTTKVVNVLRYLEQRINAMIEIWDADPHAPRAAPENTRPDSHLLSGPAREGEGVSQDEVDRLLQSYSADEAKIMRIQSGAPAEEPIDQKSIDAMFA